MHAEYRQQSLPTKDKSSRSSRYHDKHDHNTPTPSSYFNKTPFVPARNQNSSIEQAMCKGKLNALKHKGRAKHGGLGFGDSPYDLSGKNTLGSFN